MGDSAGEVHSPIFPDSELLRQKASNKPAIIIYQPYMGDQQRQGLNQGSTPLDISFARGQTTREYELFQHVHARHRTIGLKETAFWGVVSRKFEHKSSIPFSRFLREAGNAQRNGFDCYVYNPMLANCALFVNSWEQGHQGHPTLDVVTNYLAEKGYPTQLPEGNQAFFLCNYMCGNEKFWSGYFRFCEEILSDLEDNLRRGTPVGLAYGDNADYDRSPELSLRPFVIERLLGLYLQKAAPREGVKVAVYKPAKEDFHYKFGVPLGNFLHHLYLKKDVIAEKRDRTLYATWNALRNEVLENGGRVAWQADDPPEWQQQRLA